VHVHDSACVFNKLSQYGKLIIVTTTWDDCYAKKKEMSVECMKWASAWPVTTVV